ALHVGGPMHALSSNWQFGLFVNLQSGGPFSVTTTRLLESGVYAVRPDPIAGVAFWLADSNDPSKRQINPDAFLQPTESGQGKLGRNTFRAPPLRQVDFSLSRSIAVRGRGSLRLRVDAVNVLNVANIGAPRHMLGAPEFGQSYHTYADALGT